MKNTFLFLFSFATSFSLWGQKTEFYFDAGTQFVPSATSQSNALSMEFGIKNTSDTTTVRWFHQTALTKKLTIKTKATYCIGANFRKKLTPEMDFLYGLSGRYVAFNATINSTETDDFTILLKTDTLKGAQFLGGKARSITGTAGTLLVGTNYEMYSVELPLTLRYNIGSNAFALGLKMSIPVLTKAYSEYENLVLLNETATKQDFRLEKGTQTLYNPKNINAIGGHYFVSYTAWSKHLGLGFELQTQLNSLWKPFTNVSSVANFSISDTETYKVHPSTLSLKLQYRL
ncbi:MAG: hypothetical protein RLZZ292_1553 [Bacteroidota bacterium]|jgi:hypothetical protein